MSDTNISLTMPVPDDYQLPQNFENDLNEWIRDKVFSDSDPSEYLNDPRVTLEEALLAIAIKCDESEFIEKFFEKFGKENTIRSKKVREYLEVA